MPQDIEPTFCFSSKKKNETLFKIYRKVIDRLKECEVLKMKEGGKNRKE